MAKAGKMFFLFSALLALVSAYAGEKELTQAFLKDLRYYGDNADVPFTSPAFCQTLLDEELPKELLQNGLTALASQNSAAKPYRECIDESSAAWDADHSAKSTFVALFPEDGEAFPFTSRTDSSGGPIFEHEAKGKKQHVLKKRADLVNDLRYSRERLVFSYYAAVKKKGAGLSVSAFCKDYEKTQKQGEIYAKFFPVERIHASGSSYFGKLLSVFQGVDKRKSDMMLNALKSDGISEAEYAAVWEYADKYFKVINQSLRNEKLSGKKLSDEEKAFVATTNAALAKLPKHKGTVVRYACLDKEQNGLHAANTTIPYPAFTSTSSDPKFEFMVGCGEKAEPGEKFVHKFVICSDGVGSDIRQFSLYDEKEVLFPTNIRFKTVKKLPYRKVDDSFVVMVAVDANGKELGDLNKCKKDIEYQESLRN